MADQSIEDRVTVLERENEALRQRCEDLEGAIELLSERLTKLESEADTTAEGGDNVR